MLEKVKQIIFLATVLCSLSLISTFVLQTNQVYADEIDLTVEKEPINPNPTPIDGYVSFFDRGTCSEARLKHCPPGSPGKRPKGGNVNLTREQWNCLIRVYTAPFSALGKPWQIPISVWLTYNACHGVF